MRRAHRFSLALALPLLLAFGSGAAAPAAEPALNPGQPVMIALGDSWASGAGAGGRENGYVPRLHAALRESWGCSPARSERAAAKCKGLQLADLAIGGATTPSLLERQLPAALELLGDRNQDRNPRNDVEVITIHIGGNDVTNPILQRCLTGVSATCLATISAEFAAYRADLDTLLSTLREAAGPDTRIVLGTYDNPIGSCQLAPVPGAVVLGGWVLEGGGPIPAGLHDIMREVGAAYDADVASVFGQMVPADWVGGADCLHPKASGYTKVVDAFLATLGA